MRNPQFLVLLLAVAGCTPPDGATRREAANLPAPIPPASTVAARGNSAHKTSDAPGNAVAPNTAAKLALDGEGLRIFTVATGSSRAIPFGIGKAEALSMLESVQGAAPKDQGENVDCGATTAIWQDGLTVWFARDRFVGWSLASADSSLSTAGGLKVGTTRAELENGASVARIAKSSLGEEFTAGDVSGLLDSADTDARVANLWAGAVCIAR